MSASNGSKNKFKASIVAICFALALAIGVIRYLTGPEWALSANRRKFHLLRSRIYSRCKAPHRITSVHINFLLSKWF